MYEMRPEAAFVTCALLVAGCTNPRTTHTQRSAQEQLLVSTAVDRALDQADFDPFAGRAVFVEEKYLDGAGADKSYVIGSVRRRLLASDARLAAKPEDAEVIVELCSGCVGTDSADMFVGTVKTEVPVPTQAVSIPEVRLVSRNSQAGAAKIGLLAYDAKTRATLGEGVLVARADDHSWYVLGAGPYRDGEGRRQLDRALKTASVGVTFRAPGAADQGGDVGWANLEEVEPARAGAADADGDVTDRPTAGNGGTR